MYTVHQLTDNHNEFIKIIIDLLCVYLIICIYV
jgi:hypothetical protein